MLTAVDWLVMAVYGVAVLTIGWYANRRQKSTEDYFLGGRRLEWWVVGVSLVATSFSSVALIGGTGFGFEAGLSWLQLQVGDLLAVAAVCVVFLPFFAKLRLTTAYEYLEMRFGVFARSVASALFIGQTILRAAILVYAPALALATVLGWSVETAIVVAAVAAILYSSFGGIAAVVWTDLIQMCVVLFAVVFSIALVVSDVPGGMAAVLEHAARSNRLEWITFEFEPGTPFNVVGTLVPYAVFAFSLFGTGQQAVQRFLSCEDLGAARKAAFTGWGIGTAALGVTLFFGACLAAWKALVPDAAPLGALGSDRVLPEFVMARLPAGIAGLMLAAIFAASMSSLDSAIHSLSTATSVDFVRRFDRGKRDAAGELRLARLLTCLFGVLATLGALYAARAEDASLLERLVTWLGYFAGPLLGLFLLGIVSRRANEFGALVGVCGAFAWVVVLVVASQGEPWNGKPFGFHPLWLAPASCITALALGWPMSLLRPAPEDERLAGLTWARRNERGVSPGP